MTKKQLGSFDDLDFDSIDCYWETYKKLIFKDRRFLTIFAVGFFLISTIYLIQIQPSVSGVQLLPLFILFFYFTYFNWRAKKIFFADFTNKNNLIYQSSGSLSEVVGNLFKVGHTKTINNVITGRFGNKKAKFFHYKYSIGHGRYRRDFHFTVLEVFFDKINFPHMLLQSKKRRSFWGEGRYGKRGRNERSVALEDEFSQHYNLFFHDGYGVEATQIFSEDFLRFLKEQKSFFNIELKEDRLYIYDSTTVRSKRDFKELFGVTGRVINKIAPVLKRLDRDFAALNEAYGKM